MSTVIKPNISPKNPNWISKERYYELKHFCFQYSEWHERLKILGTANYQSPQFQECIHGSDISDPTERIAERRAYFSHKIDLVDSIAKKAASDLAPYLLRGVTEHLTYEALMMDDDRIPCCRDTYYDIYRRFFYLLDLARN